MFLILVCLACVLVSFFVFCFCQLDNKHVTWEEIPSIKKISPFIGLYRSVGGIFLINNMGGPDHSATLGQVVLDDMK